MMKLRIQNRQWKGKPYATNEKKYQPTTITYHVSYNC